MLRVQPNHVVNYINFRGRLDSRPKYNNDGDTFDSFTGLKDKSALLLDLGRKMYRKEDISIGMFDLDNFKSVNELLGYKVGDEFIKAVSEDISIVADKHKVDAYRFGGDEFVVLLFSGDSQEKKKEVVEEVIKRISENPKIQGKSQDYLDSAQSLLSSYEKDNSVVNSVIEANTRYNILADIWNNSTIAKEDLYVQESLEQAKNNKELIYSFVLSKCIEDEADPKIKKALKRYSLNVDKDKENIDEYIFGKFDRNHETYRLRRWIKDFNQNGFSLTGGIISFKPSYYKRKQPIDLISDVGELLKKGKADLKGRTYIMEME